MCGILGAFWKRPPQDAGDRVKNALSALKHRGPNDEGYNLFTAVGNDSSELHLAHTRLSILDLTEAGHQPMQSHCGRYSIVYNGEIYNYLELRSELIGLGHHFSTETDTEVLLAAWAQWEQSCLVKLVGMFAFVIYDSVACTLICVRDAFGIKPFFLSIESGCSFLFASELQPLLQVSASKAKVNYQRVHDYLVHGLQDAPGSTFVEGVQHLPPAHFMVVDLATVSIRETKAWWIPRIKQNCRLNYSSAAEKLRELFLDSVRLHLRSDVPVGAALSGGIDSSAIVCAMRTLEPDLPIHTFSYVADDPHLSEERWIDLVNQHVGAISHKIKIFGDDLMNDLEELVGAQGEPFNSTSMYAQYRVFKEAKAQGVPVILEGQGADELLGGYQGYPGQRMRSLLERGQWFKMLGFSNAWSANADRGTKSPWRALVGQLLPESLHARAYLATMTPGERALIEEGGLARCSIKKITPDLGRRWSGYGRRLSEALAFSLIGHELPTLLRFGDRNAMHFSIENRVPFLTVEMADFLLSLPEDFLVSDMGETKKIFRTAMRGIVPDAILDRTDKIGFFTPMETWINANFKLFAESISESPVSELLGWDPFYKEWQNGQTQQSKSVGLFWRAINLSCWAMCTKQLRWDLR